LIGGVAVESTGGEYDFWPQTVAEEDFSTPRTGLAQSSSATAYQNQTVHKAESP